MTDPNAAPQTGTAAHGQTKTKKPFWKKWWFWLIIVIVVAAMAGSQGAGESGDTSAADGQSAATSQQSGSDTAGKTDSGAKTDQGGTQSTESQVPADYRSALRQADTYANTMHMSKAGVYAQLTSEYGGKFSAEAAQYAVDNVKADWNANALATARNYQETMAMSPEAIRDQLTSSAGDKFTAEEADYAIQHLNE